MFYVVDKIIPYPGRSVIADVISREGAASSESSTPYSGMHGLIADQFKTNNDVSIQDFLIYVGNQDFDPSSARPADDVTEEDVNNNYFKRELRANEIGDYYVYLEEIEEFWISKFVKDKLLAYLKYKGGYREDKTNLMTTYSVTDKETGEQVNESDLRVERDVDIEDFMRAKKKLPYLLKMLHRGSILYKGSLLSFIIVRERLYRRTQDREGFNLYPRNFFDVTYKMGSSGKILGAFDADSNKQDTFAQLVSWVKGTDPNNVYYKYYQELMEVLSILEIDITKEDPLMYQGEYMNTIACAYLASNKEYMETEALIDNKILNVLSPDMLFRKGLGSMMFEDESSDASDCIETEASLISTISSVLRSLDVIEKNAKPQVINKILNLIYAVRLKSTTVKTSRDFNVGDGLLRNSYGECLVIKHNLLVESATPGRYVISTNGWLIPIKPIHRYLYYYDLEKLKPVAGREDIYDTKLEYIEL